MSSRFDRYVDYTFRKLLDGPFEGHVAKLIKVRKICYFVQEPQPKDAPFAITGHEYALDVDGAIYKYTGRVVDCLSESFCLVRDYDAKRTDSGAVRP